MKYLLFILTITACAPIMRPGTYDIEVYYAKDTYLPENEGATWQTQWVLTKDSVTGWTLNTGLDMVYYKGEFIDNYLCWAVSNIEETGCGLGTTMLIMFWQLNKGEIKGVGTLRSKMSCVEESLVSIGLITGARTSP
jgi:hypothetical protein